jgi:nucleotide-binding universal stress UspA family protein
MKPFDKILVPFDFSPSSEHALLVAADLTRHYEATLCVAHVYEPMLYPAPEAFMLYTQEQEPTLIAQYDKLLARASDDARKAGATRVESKLLQGMPVTEIVRFAREASFGLIVMGTHGRTGIAHALIGSVAERVVRKAPCPVLVIREGAAAQGL